MNSNPDLGGCMVIRVAVIGAGAAGLCALRHLTAQPDVFHAVCFEKNASVGGTWIYTDETGTDKNGLPVQSSMYKNLRTNLPKEVMAFPDFPFDTSLPSFIKHTDVLKYLESYSAKFNLLHHIKFKTLIQHVSPGHHGNKWNISYSTITQQDKTENEEFDAVMICNGHYEIPYEPAIAGQDRFKGEIIHSHNYRHPEDFTGKNVVCLGAAASGQDIAIDVATRAKHVYLSHNKKLLETVLPLNVEQRPGIKELREHSIVFNDSQEVEIDTLLLCTGYLYNLPFLSKKVGLSIEQERLYPLYKHLIHPHFTTLSFIGIPKTICPFPLFDMQIRFTISAWDGSMKLPSVAEMLEDIDADFKKRLADGLPVRYAHTMGPRQWRYNDQLADMAKTSRLPISVEHLYDYVHETRVKDIAGYKSISYKLDELNGGFVQIVES